MNEKITIYDYHIYIILIFNDCLLISKALKAIFQYEYFYTEYDKSR